MQLSMQNYQAIFLTKINIVAFNILIQLNLDQIKVGFTSINKIHADVKVCDIQQVLTSALEHREFPQDIFLEYNPNGGSLLSFNLIFYKRDG